MVPSAEQISTSSVKTVSLLNKSYPQTSTAQASAVSSQSSLKSHSIASIPLWLTQLSKASNSVPSVEHLSSDVIDSFSQQLVAVQAPVQEDKDSSYNSVNVQYSYKSVTNYYPKHVARYPTSLSKM